MAKKDRTKADVRRRAGRGERLTASATSQPSPFVLEGVRQLQQGRTDQAEASFQAALSHDANDLLALNCLGIIAKQQANLELANSFFSQALAVQPNFAEALSNQGNVLREQGRWDEAIEKYAAAIRQKPSLAEAHNGLGAVRMALGELPQAVAAFREAIRWNARSAEAQNNLGNALRELGELRAAVAAFEIALQLAPAAAEIHNNLAIAQRELGELAEAREHCQRAVQLNPQFADAWGNLAACLLHLGELQTATECLQRAVSIQPDSISLLTNLFNLLRQQDRAEEARSVADQLQRAEPENVAQVVRRSAVWPAIFSGTAAGDNFANTTLEEWRRLEQIDWPQRWQSSDPSDIGCEPPFNLQFIAESVRPWKEAYARLVQPQLQQRFPQFFRELDSSKKIAESRTRVGVVVTRGHEGIFLKSMKRVLQQLNSELFEIVVFCPLATSQRVEAEFATHSTSQGVLRIAPTPAGFQQTAELIRAAACDVLLYWEIGTDAANYFLPFLRLAPVQCTSWGVQVTSGIPNVDFYLSNRLVEPPDGQDHYSEKLLRAGDTLLTFQSPVQIPTALKSREAFGFSTDQHLYVCAQQLGKFHSDFDQLLAGILRNDPQGVVAVTQDRDGYVASQLRQRWEETLPDVCQRLVFVPRLSGGEYLSLLAAADVLLDPPHFSGVNSTYDGLSLGKPIVSFPQDFHRSRYTFGCYQKMKVMDCVAISPHDYVQLAVSLGSDVELRREVETLLREARPLLFEDVLAITEHERLLAQLGELAKNSSRTASPAKS